MRIVVALGGNALLRRGERPDAGPQLEHITAAAVALAPLARDHELLICHGNGPQVGLLALESDADRSLTRAYPLDALVAQTQGMIGYWLTQALTNALSSHPDANVVHLPVDSLLPNVAPAIQESGRSKDLLVIGGEGNFKANLEAIRRDGAQDAAIALDLGWESWAQVDDLNRYFAGQKPVYGGWAWTVIDKDHNLPPEGQVWNSKVDYAAAYRKLWGT